MPQAYAGASAVQSLLAMAGTARQGHSSEKNHSWQYDFGTLARAYCRGDTSRGQGERRQCCRCG